MQIRSHDVSGPRRMLFASAVPFEEQGTADVEKICVMHVSASWRQVRDLIHIPRDCDPRLSSVTSPSQYIRYLDVYTSITQACLRTAEVMSQPILELTINAHTCAARPRHPHPCSV